MLRFLKLVYRVVSSLGFGVFMLVLMAVILAVATGYEAGAGTQAVQVKIYKSTWFDLLLWLFILNLTLATLGLRPFKLHHTGVVVHHFSILLIAAGALLTRHVGFEGTLTLGEGENSDRLPISGFSLSLYQDEELLDSAPLELRGGDEQLELSDRIEFADGDQLQLLQYLPAATTVDTIVAATVGNPAYQIELTGSGISARHWLLIDEEGRSSMRAGDHLNIEVLSPVTDAEWQEAVEEMAAGQVAEQLILHFPELDLHQTFNLTAGEQIYDIEGTAWQLAVLNRYRNFSLDAQNKPFDRPGQEADNPAISFELRADGFSDRYTYFLKMPGFDPLHGKQPSLARADVSWQPGNSRLNLLITRHTDTDEYRFALQQGADEVRIVEAVDAVELESAIRQVEVTGYLPQAVVSEKVVPAAVGHGHGRSALQFVRLSAEGSETAQEPEWCYYNLARPLVGEMDNESARLIRFERASLPMGFNVELIDFKEETYPGSRRASTYSSLIEINDVAAGSTFTALISMNDPLVYRGLKFFQSSFSRNRVGETTVLTVTHDPGTFLVYFGSILMVVGLIMIYYLKKRFLNLERKRKAKRLREADPLQETPSAKS